MVVRPDAAQTRLIGSHVAEVARRTPRRIAVVEGGRRIDYGELDREVHRVARGLIALGVDRGDVVTIELPNWWETNVVIHAVLRIGAIPNPVVPIYRDREMRFIIAQARPKVVVVPQIFRGFDFLDMLDRLTSGATAGSSDAPTVVVVRPDGAVPAHVLTYDDLPLGDDASVDAAAGAAAADDIALLLYTSGTTADPKGVLHDHHTLDHENRSIIELFRLGHESTVFMGSPVTHITGFLYGVLLPPMLGATAVLLDVWEPNGARGLIDAESCRFTVGATPFLQGLTDVYDESGAPCPLHVFACGGADVPSALVRRARSVLDATVVRVYGSSEFPTVTCSGPDDDEHLAADTDGRPIGTQIECRIDEPDTDGVGELLARGPELFLGYLDAALDADAFVEDRWFRTGDLASIDAEGAVTIRGRSKDIIVRGGENISAKEIEDLLYVHPAVREVAVVAMADPVMVERACAFVVTEPGVHLELPELVDFLDQHRLARQKFPERLVLVDELPKTASGKVQKFVLRARLARPPDPTAQKDPIE
ncbi:MAG: AMP-binding protein [Ilumatobacteraceae bacterium]